MSSSDRRPRLALILALALVAALPLLRTLRLGAMDHYLATQRYEDVYYLPPAEWLPVLSLGWDEALADLIWSRALIYFGDELKHKGDVQHVREYGEAMLRLDPDFKAVYSWVATAGTYRTGEVKEEDFLRSIEFLERGVRRFPDDGELAWELGATLTYELAPLVEDPERQRELRRRGMEHLMVAARKGAGPDWLALSNATQLRKLGQMEQAARHIEEMYGSVRDPSVRDQLRAQLRKLRSRVHAEAVAEAWEQLRQRREQDYPWMPLGLYLLVGPKPPVDEAALLERRFQPAAPAGLGPTSAN